MEINPKRVFSGEKADLNNQNNIQKKKKKDVSENHGEKIVKSPANPSFYSSYIGVHKNTSFGKSVATTKDERIAYLKGLKTQDGKSVFDEKMFEEGEEKNNLIKICENDECFEFFKTLCELKYDNGQKVLRDENMESLVEISAMFSQEQKEKIELFDILNAEIKADARLKDFLELFINEKEDDGSYKYTFESVIGSLFMAYICIPEDVGAEEIKNNYDLIQTANKESGEPELDTNTQFELLLYKCGVNRDFDIKANIKEIKRYAQTGISSLVAASVLSLDEEKKNIFDRLASYKKEDGNSMFNGEIMYQIARSNDNPDELFASLEKLSGFKKADGTPLFESYSLSRLLSAGTEVCKRAETIADIEDSDVKESVAGLYDLAEILKDNEILPRVIKAYEQKDKDGIQILNIHFLDNEIYKDKAINERFVKFATPISCSGVSNYQITSLIKSLSDEQCQRILDLAEFAKNPDGSSAFGYNLPDVYVQDDETFTLAKTFFQKKNEDGSFVISPYAIHKIFENGKEYAKKYLTGIDILESIGEKISSSNVEALIKDDETLKKAELFKGITGKGGKKLISAFDLGRYVQLDYQKAQRQAKVLSMKTPDGEDIVLSESVMKEIIQGSEEEYQNVIKYAPLLADIKGIWGQRVFTDGKELTECAKKGESAYLRAKKLVEMKNCEGKARINANWVPYFVKLNDEGWSRFTKVVSAKNSYGEELFSEESSILEVISCDNFDEVMKKAIDLSELRYPENEKERLLTDWAISDTAKADGDYKGKLKEYAPKLFVLKDTLGRPVITQGDIHYFVVETDMSVDNLVKYISIFKNCENKGIDRTVFPLRHMVIAIKKGEEYCEEAIKWLKEISAKKTTNNSDYVDMSRFEILLGEDIDYLKEYKRKLDRFDEFKDYPQENNLCFKAGTLATLSDEKLDEIFKFSRLKDTSEKPFFTADEVMTITNSEFFNTNLSSVKILRELSAEEKENLQETINKVCALKDTMCEKPELYVNGTFDNPDDAKGQIEFLFSQHKGALVVLANTFDKETINNIMRQRTAHATEILDTLGSFNKDQIDILKKLLNSTNQDGKPFMPAQKIQFINILNAYSQNNFKTTEIEEMLNSGKVDIGKLELDLLKNIIRQTKISEDVIAKIPPEKIIAWNSPYLHLLVNDMVEDSDMRDFFVNALTKNFDEYILDSSNEYGQANAKTKEIFEKEGLNYQQWVKPNEDLAIHFISRDKNAEAMLQITEQIQEDIEELRKTPAKKFIDKQLSKYIKEDKFTVPTNCQMSKTLLTEFVQNTIKQLNSVWERAQKNSESENSELRAKAQNTLTILSHLEQRIKDIEKTPDVNFSKNLDLTIKMWERKPEYDIFQGNYSTCCIGIGNFNSSAMPHYIMNTSYNMIEIKDNHTGKTMGNALCYLIKDGNGKPAFVIDNIEIDNGSKPSNEIGIEIRNKMAEYASKVAKEITGRDDTPVYMSSHYNDVSTEDLKSERQKIQFLGDIDTGHIYMDLYNGWINSKEQLSAEANVLKLK